MQPFGHNRNGPKIGEGAPPTFGGRGLGPHLTQSRLGWGLPPCQVPASSIQPFGRNKHWPKIWGLCPPFGEGRAGSPSNTKSPGPRPSSIPSDILIHAAIWPQQVWAEIWGLCPFGGEGAGSPSNTMWPGPRPTCVPSFILIRPTVWSQYTNVTERQTGNGLMAQGEPFYKRSPKNREKNYTIWHTLLL